MRRLIAPLLILLTIGPVPLVYQHRPPENADNRVTAQRMAGILPGARTGPARLAEAWQLASDNSRFGGFSALTLIGERGFQLFTDRGDVWNLTLAPDGAVSGVARHALLPVNAQGAVPMPDIESAYRDPASGRIWLGVERRQEIWRIEPDLTRVARRRHPVMRQWPSNGGPEAMARLASGRVMVLSESVDTDSRGLEAVMFLGEPTQRRTRSFRFFYDPADMGRPTSAAALDDGRVLILHRRVQLAGLPRTQGLALGRGPLLVATLAIADPRTIGPDDVLRSRKLAVLDSAPLAENWEAMAVQPRAGGGVSVWLASDDNFNAWQRSLLIRLDLADVALAERPAHQKRRP